MSEFIAMLCFCAGAAIVSSFIISVLMACGIVEPDDIGVIIAAMILFFAIFLLREIF